MRILNFFYVRNEVRSLNFIARLRKKGTPHFSSIQTLKCPKKAHFSFPLGRSVECICDLGHRYILQILILKTFSILANCQNLLISGSKEYLVSEVAAQLELSCTVFRYFYLVHSTFYSNPSLGIIHTYRMALRPD